MIAMAIKTGHNSIATFFFFKPALPSSSFSFVFIFTPKTYPMAVFLAFSEASKMHGQKITLPVPGHFTPADGAGYRIDCSTAVSTERYLFSTVSVRLLITTGLLRPFSVPAPFMWA